MAPSELAKWKPAFDDLVLEITPAAAPTDDNGDWFEAIAQFSRQSYVRLLVSPLDEALVLRLEAALEPHGGRALEIADALRAHLAETTGSDWSTEGESPPWVLTTELSQGEKATNRLRRVLARILSVADDFERVSSADGWLQRLDAGAFDGDNSSATEESADAASRDTGDQAPFETIGDGATDDALSAADEATLVATLISRRKDDLLVELGFAARLENDQLDAIEEGLEHHLHTKFTATAEAADRSEQSGDLPADVDTAFPLRVRPATGGPSLESLESDVAGFLERLEKFSSFGVDLFDYLGVGETVLGDSQDPDDRRPQTPPTRSERSTGRRRSDGEPENQEATVLALDAETATSGLEPENFTDPRLQRNDATTPLVDVVLRHPGYSDRRIGQVLSILLSIEYHDALDIADDAPCVIAWGLGRKRAKRFQDVIESAGGKVLLVEPGTFEEN